jgi:hypothetical protein
LVTPSFTLRTIRAIASAAYISKKLYANPSNVLELKSHTAQIVRNALLTLGVSVGVILGGCVGDTDGTCVGSLVLGGVVGDTVGA